jgi:aspartyl-tRNA(Asn)/glutamyl-tRNA(Gln) amidotransferase subunit A
MKLVYLTATEALRLFKSREISPVELMEAIRDHTEKVEPKINAFSEQFFESAIGQAKDAEKIYLDKNASPRPLEGLPVALKDEHSIKGMPASEGSLLTKDEIAEYTHPIVERIVAAGGIIHARTTTPEFSCAAFTHSKVWGITRNPWNLAYSPGGSSGGSCAALAAGTAVLATGSDIGGSIRIPASFSGVVGFKPPYGRVPALPPYNLDHYCHDGPLARTVADCALLENVIAGPHPQDVVSLKPKIELPEAFGDIKGWRIALSVHLGDYLVDSEVAANTLAVGDALRQAGALVEEVELNWRKEDIHRAAEIHYGTIFGSAVSQLVLDHQELAMPYTIEFAKQSLAIFQEASAIEGLEIEGLFYAELGLLLDEFDALICPTNAVSGLLAVPSGQASNSVPTGVQIVGPTYEDEKVFRIGSALEKVRPWFTSPSWRPEYKSTAD